MLKTELYGLRRAGRGGPLHSLSKLDHDSGGYDEDDYVS